MWLGQQAAVNHAKSKAGAGSGQVTIDALQPAVYLESEKRSLPMALAGCYFWRPEKEQEALVVRTGDGLRYVLGLLGQEKALDIELAPGEAAFAGKAGYIHMAEDLIRVKTENCSIVIKDDSVFIEGKLYLNGLDVDAALRGE